MIITVSIIFLILTVIIAIVPAFQADRMIDLSRYEQPSAELIAGRKLYLKENCGACHTQFIRDLVMDQPYGRASIAADYAFEVPPLLGTQRTGPDLSNTGKRQPSEVWNLIHLYNPRAVMPSSIMPSYPWFFETKDTAGPTDITVPVPEAYRPADQVVIAKPEAIYLVRYLQSLKQMKVD